MTLVAANVALPRRPASRVVDVETTAQLAEAVARPSSRAHVLLMAAAVADFRAPSREVAEDHAARRGSSCAWSRPRTSSPGPPLGAPDQTLVGFAAEPGAEAIERAASKLERKGVDAIVFNDVSRAEIGFDSDPARLQGRDRRGDSRPADNGRGPGAAGPSTSMTDSTLNSLAASTSPLQTDHVCVGRRIVCDRVLRRVQARLLVLLRQLQIIRHVGLAEHVIERDHRLDESGRASHEPLRDDLGELVLPGDEPHGRVREVLSHAGNNRMFRWSVRDRAVIFRNELFVRELHSPPGEIRASLG